MARRYRKTVLIVEYDEHERYLLSLMLKNAGYTVHMASNECLALEQMKHRRFDVVVSAHHMPQINGFRLVLIGRIIWPSTPLILLSEEGTSLSEIAEHGGVYGSLRKPYDSVELLKLIGNAIPSVCE